jgi:hypothetical protein
LTSRLPRDEPGEWLTIGEAAARLGLSPSGFRGLAQAEGIPVERRGSRPGVRATEIVAFIERARIRPGEFPDEDLEPIPVRPGDMTEGFIRAYVDGVPGVEEADAIRRRFGWSDHDLAKALGVDWSVLSRYRVKGFPAHRVQQLRALIRRPL